MRVHVPPARIPLLTLAAGAFALIASESMAAGLLPNIAETNRVNVGTAALVVSLFAAGQVVGAFVLGVPVARFAERYALSGLLASFAAVQGVGNALQWPFLLGSRIVCGALAAAFFSVALGYTARSNSEAEGASATTTLFAGLTAGTTLGPPLSVWLGSQFGWRFAFELDSGVSLLAALLVVVLLPMRDPHDAAAAPSTKPVLSGRFWLALVSAGLSIGAAVLAFTFASSILERITRVPPAGVTWLLALYGAAALAGNWLVGRLVPSGATRLVTVGNCLMLLGLFCFWNWPASVVPVAFSLVTLGLCGVSLNPAHAARALAIGGVNPTTTALLPTVATAGILIATSIGAAVVESGGGVLSPVVVAIIMVALALTLIVPAHRSHVPTTRSNRSTLP